MLGLINRKRLLTATVILTTIVVVEKIVDEVGSTLIRRLYIRKVGK